MCVYMCECSVNGWNPNVDTCIKRYGDHVIRLVVSFVTLMIFSLSTSPWNEIFMKFGTDVQHPFVISLINFWKVKVRVTTAIQVKGKGLSTCYSAAYEIRTAALYNLGSGSWLAWANDTVVHYAAIHCPRWWTVGPAVQHTDIPPPQSVH